MADIPKIYTVQKKMILNHINEKGIYYPNFDYSAYPQEVGQPELVKLYRVVLDAFNQNNKCEFPGLAFCFLVGDYDGIYFWSDYEAFQQVMREKKAAIASLWNKLATDDYVILELDAREYPFNYISLDINDFQFLMPPVMVLPPYDEDDVQRIIADLFDGLAPNPKLLSNIFQAHIPYITKESILNVYPVFSI